MPELQRELYNTIIKEMRKIEKESYSKEEIYYDVYGIILPLREEFPLDEQSLENYREKIPTMYNLLERGLEGSEVLKKYFVKETIRTSEKPSQKLYERIIDYLDQYPNITDNLIEIVFKTGENDEFGCIIMITDEERKIVKGFEVVKIKPSQKTSTGDYGLYGLPKI